MEGLTRCTWESETRGVIYELCFHDGRMVFEAIGETIFTTLTKQKGEKNLRYLNSSKAAYGNIRYDAFPNTQQDKRFSNYSVRVKKGFLFPRSF